MTTIFELNATDRFHIIFILKPVDSIPDGVLDTTRFKTVWVNRAFGSRSARRSFAAISRTIASHGPARRCARPAEYVAPHEPSVARSALVMTRICDAAAGGTRNPPCALRWSSLAGRRARRQTVKITQASMASSRRGGLELQSARELYRASRANRSCASGTRQSPGPYHSRADRSTECGQLISFVLSSVSRHSGAAPHKV